MGCVSLPAREVTPLRRASAAVGCKLATCQSRHWPTRASLGRANYCSQEQTRPEIQLTMIRFFGGNYGKNFRCILTFYTSYETLKKQQFRYIIRFQVKLLEDSLFEF